MALFMALAAVIVVAAAAVDGCFAAKDVRLKGDERARKPAGTLPPINDALRQESEYKSTFLATMSHRLRTPAGFYIALSGRVGTLRCRRGARDADRALWVTSAAIAPGFWPLSTTLSAASLEAGRYRVDIEPLDVLDGECGGADGAPVGRRKGVRFSVELDAGFLWC